MKRLGGFSIFFKYILLSASLLFIIQVPSRRNVQNCYNRNKCERRNNIILAPASWLLCVERAHAAQPLELVTVEGGDAQKRTQFLLGRRTAGTSQVSRRQYLLAELASSSKY
jgi:hypothetical protein